MKYMENCTKLNEKELKGFVSLLQDSESDILPLMAQQLSKFNPESIQAIEKLAENSNNEELIDNWYHTSRLSIKYIS